MLLIVAWYSSTFSTCCCRPSSCTCLPWHRGSNNHSKSFSSNCNSNSNNSCSKSWLLERLLLECLHLSLLHLLRRRNLLLLLLDLPYLPFHQV